jgi:hypothetical protein
MGYMAFANVTDAESRMNFYSHTIGAVDDCYRCIWCEVGVWNAHKMQCSAA